MDEDLKTSCHELNPFYRNRRGMRYIALEHFRNGLILCDNDGYSRTTKCKSDKELIVFNWILNRLETVGIMGETVDSYKIAGWGGYGIGFKVKCADKTYFLKIFDCRSEKNYNKNFNELLNEMILMQEFAKHKTGLFKCFYEGVVFNQISHPGAWHIYEKDGRIIQRPVNDKLLNSIIKNGLVNTGYLVSDYSEGDLDKLYEWGVIEHKNFNDAIIRLYSHIIQILTGLLVIHEHGYGHYDLKEGNIVYDKQGEDYILKITDLGAMINKESEEKIRTVTSEYAFATEDIMNPITNDPIIKEQFDRISVSRIFINLVKYLVHMFFDKGKKLNNINYYNMYIKLQLDKHRGNNRFVMIGKTYDRIVNDLVKELYGYNVDILIINLIDKTYKMLSYHTEDVIYSVKDVLFSLFEYTDMIYFGFNEPDFFSKKIRDLIKRYMDLPIDIIMKNDYLRKLILEEKEDGEVFKKLVENLGKWYVGKEYIYDIRNLDDDEINQLRKNYEKNKIYDTVSKKMVGENNENIKKQIEKGMIIKR